MKVQEIQHRNHKLAVFVVFSSYVDKDTILKKSIPKVNTNTSIINHQSVPNTLS